MDEYEIVRNYMDNMSKSIHDHPYNTMSFLDILNEAHAYYFDISEDVSEPDYFEKDNEREKEKKKKIDDIRKKKAEKIKRKAEKIKKKADEKKAAFFLEHSGDGLSKDTLNEMYSVHQFQFNEKIKKMISDKKASKQGV
jgi:hypothetical protein